MARTTSKLVQGILGRNYQKGVSLTSFIDSASSLIDDVEACANEDETVLSAAKLAILEMWVAAHCYCMMDPIYQSKNTDGAGATFQGQAGMGLQSTRYGQMALSLDPSGCLAAIGMNQSAGGFWMGKRPSEQTDYVDRD